VNKNMKKIMVAIGICIVLAAMPMTTAFPLFGSHVNVIQKHIRPTLTNGSYNGVYAMKNESGYIPLGELNGTYNIGEWSGTFNGTWSQYDGNASGTISGWILSHLFFGQLYTTGSNQSSTFIGLYRVNTTDNSFEAAAILFGNDQYNIRYAIGTI
jgi:hypothetical protein